MIILSAFLLLFNSCLTVGRIERNCDKFAKVCVTSDHIVEYRDTVIFINDTIRLVLPSDTVTITDTLRIIEGSINLSPIRKKFGVVAAEASVLNNRLSVNAWVVDSTLFYPRTDTVYIRSAIINTTDTQKIQMKYIPGFYYFTFYGFFIMLTIVFLYVGVRLIASKLDVW